MLAAEEPWIVMVVVTVLHFVGHILNPWESLMSGQHLEPTEALTPILHKPHRGSLELSRLIPQSGFKFAFNSVFLFRCH